VEAGREKEAGLESAELGTVAVAVAAAFCGGTTRDLTQDACRTKRGQAARRNGRLDLRWTAVSSSLEARCWPLGELGA